MTKVYRTRCPYTLAAFRQQAAELGWTVFGGEVGRRDTTFIGPDGDCVAVSNGLGRYAKRLEVVQIGENDASVLVEGLNLEEVPS